MPTTAGMGFKGDMGAGFVAALTDALILLGAPPGQMSTIIEHALAVRLRPVQLSRTLEHALAGVVERVLVNGTFERRVLSFDLGAKRWVGCSLSGLPLEAISWPVGKPGDLLVDEPARAVSTLHLSDQMVYRLSRPGVLLVGLYHPENFPLPRFPLGISDLARAVRDTMMGQVRLLDMQLGSGIEEIRNELLASSPDIVGISATFGQHDVLEDVMEVLSQLSSRPLVVFGGSLSALNRQILLEAFPDGLVCCGPGEQTMQDIVSYWHGLLELDDVRLVARNGVRAARLTSTPLNRDYLDVVPELDLLEQTLDCSGVMQLESSRGCTHACSFCPRTHKGRWTGHPARLFENVLAEVDRAYTLAPSISRKLFLVDEEFVGSDKNGDALERALGMCDLLDGANFRWETSTRVDQVYRPDRDRDWHLQRIRFWAHLRDHGLNRCLFGVESGVDSILKRFNKHATAEQNALAIRLLTALGVPIRCTYITFDQLMTMDELIENYRFLGRDDLVLAPSFELNPSELFDAVRDPSFVAQRRLRKSFYSAVSYMLVSMEALIGSPYLARVEAAGLAGDWEPSMGRRHANFQDPRIGAMSEVAQRWVDRNFSFDYTLKSLEKISQGEEYRAVRAARAALKRSAYTLLGRMLANTCAHALPLADQDDASDVSTCDVGAFDEQAANELLQRSFGELLDEIDPLVEQLEGTLVHERRDVVQREHRRWSTREHWELING